MALPHTTFEFIRALGPALGGHPKVAPLRPERKHDYQFYTRRAALNTDYSPEHFSKP